MIQGALADIDEARLNELLGASESVTLEFKRELPGSDERAKSELLKDVCAMANTAGGDIIGEPFDAAQRRLAQVLDAIEPRLVALKSWSVALAAGGYVMVLRVSQSLTGPHCYVQNGRFRFPRRDGSRSVDMTYDQLRSAFDQKATLTERAQKFRQTRLNRIREGDVWREMKTGPVCVIHAIPISSAGGRHAVDVGAVYQEAAGLMMKHWSGGSRLLNLDGLLTYSQSGPSVSDYLMLFRTGALEIVAVVGAEHQGEKWLASASIGNLVRDALEVSLAAFRRFQITGPAIFGIALIGTNGYQFALGQMRQFFHGTTLADRDGFVLPETWIEDVSAPVDADVVARPILDILWQSFGLTHCLDYTPEGKWAPGK